MSVVIVTNSDGCCVAAIQAYKILDPEFAAQAREIHGWEDAEDEVLLEAQSFVAWFRCHHPKYRLLSDCLNNDMYDWSLVDIWTPSDIDDDDCDDCDDCDDDSDDLDEE